MRKSQSWLNNSIRSFTVIPLITAFSFLFCVESEEVGLTFISNGDEELYAEIEIGYLLPSEKDSSGLLLYTVNDELLTGEVSWFNKETQKLRRVHTFKDGLVTEEVEYDDDKNQFSKVEYLYSNGKHSGFRWFGENDQLLRTQHKTFNAAEELTHVKEWYKNGNPKYELAYDELSNYQGLYTLYDPEGNISTQERYKDGELVEKIK